MTSTEAPTWERAIGATPSWRVSPAGVRTVTWLELRRLMRARRWLIAWAVWTVIVTGLCGLIILSVVTLGGDVDESAGTTVFGFIVLVVLSFGLLVAPGLASTSINGDSRDGTLATLQATLVSPAEIALGKLLAGWAGTTALVAGALPSLIIAFAIGGTSVERLLVIVLLVGISLAVVTAVGLGVSALVSKPVAGVIVSYVVVFCLAVVSPMLVGLSAALFVTEETTTVIEPVTFDSSGNPNECVERQSTGPVPRTDFTWWLLLSSPYVVVADAAPVQPSTSEFEVDVLRGLGDISRSARLGPELVQDFCTDAADEQRAEDIQALPPVWPWGLGFYLLLVLGSLAVTVRRLSTPVRRLPAGQRIA